MDNKKQLKTSIVILIIVFAVGSVCGFFLSNTYLKNENKNKKTISDVISENNITQNITDNVKEIVEQKISTITPSTSNLFVKDSANVATICFYENGSESKENLFDKVKIDEIITILNNSSIYEEKVSIDLESPYLVLGIKNEEEKITFISDTIFLYNSKNYSLNTNSLNDIKLLFSK